MKHFLKRTLSLLLVAALTTALLPPLTGIAEAPAPQVWETDDIWSHTLVSGSAEESLLLHSEGGEGVNIGGSIHSNSDFQFEGNSLTISGTASASGAVNAFGESVSIGQRLQNAAEQPLPDVYDDILSRFGGSAQTYDRGKTFHNDKITISSPVVGSDKIELAADTSMNGKFGAVSAEFLASVYDDPAKWESIFPAFEAGASVAVDTDGKKDLVELNEISNFIGVKGIENSAPASWKNIGDLPNHPYSMFSQSPYIDEYVRSIVPDIQAMVDPSDPGSVGITGGQNTYQLIGNYPNLEYICINGYADVNLAGNFPKLKGVYVQSGSILLGTKDVGFYANGAKIVDQYGCIMVYAAKDVTMENCIVATTAKIAIRGAGKTAAPSSFRADGSFFAAGNNVMIGDMNDSCDVRLNEIPCFYSQSALSIVNCSFDMLQGAFVTRDGAMVIASSDIDVLRGFIFSENGIHPNQVSANESAYIPGGAFPQDVGFGNESYQPMGTEVGSIHALENAPLPEKFTLVESAPEFLTRTKQLKVSGEYVDYYNLGYTEPRECEIELGAPVLAEKDIYITTDKLTNAEEAGTVLASHTGDVTICAQDIDWGGVIYAPGGTVTIQCDTANLRGRIFAGSIVINGKTVTVTPGANDAALMEPDLRITVNELEGAAQGTLFQYREEEDAYVLNAASAALSGSAASKSDINSISYTLENDLETKTESLPAGTEWTIENLAFAPGFNILSITASDSASHSRTNTYYIYNQYDGAVAPFNGPAEGAGLNGSDDDVLFTGDTAWNTNATYTGKNITVNGNLTVSSDVILQGSRLSVTGDITIAAGGSLAAAQSPGDSFIEAGGNVTVTGGLYLAESSGLVVSQDLAVSGTANVKSAGTVRVSGNMEIIQNGVLNLLGSEEASVQMNVTGNITAAGRIFVGGGSVLASGGDIRIQKASSGSYVASTGRMIAFDADSKIICGGDFYTQSTGYLKTGYGNGVLEFHGNFQQLGTTYFYPGFEAEKPGIGKIVFKGEEEQHVSFARRAYNTTLGRIAVANDPGCLNIDSSLFWVSLAGNATLKAATLNTIGLDTNGYTATLTGGLNLTSGNIDGRLEVAGHMSCLGLTSVSGRMEAGGTLQIPGSLHVETNGRVNTQNNTLISGRLAAGGTYYTGGNLIMETTYANGITGTSHGSVNLYQDTSKIIVQGNFRTQSTTYSYWGYHSGTLELHGNFAQVGEQSCFIQPEGTDFKLVFASKGNQSVSFGRYDKNAALGNIYKTSNQGSIVLQSRVYSFIPQSDLIFSGSTEVLTNVRMNGMIVRFKDPVRFNGTVDLGGGALVCDSNVTMMDACLNPNGGIFRTNGSLYLNGSSTLCLDQPESAAVVMGSVYHNSRSKMEFTAGLLDIKGNYVQSTTADVTFGENAYIQFSGDAVQTVTVPAGSRNLQFYYVGLKRDPNVSGNYNFPYTEGLMKGYYSECIDTVLPTNEIQVRNFGVPGVHGPTGNYSQTFDDMTVQTVVGEVSISRTYNSLDTGSSVTGKGFTFGYDMRVKTETQETNVHLANNQTASIQKVYKLVTLSNGQQWKFLRQTDGSYAAENCRGEFTESSSGYVLKTPDQTKYVFSSAGDIQYFEDKLGNRLNVTVDANHRITALGDAIGTSVSFAYTGGLLTTVTDERSNRTVSYTYNAGGYLTAATNFGGRTTRYGYDASGKMSWIKDNLGRTVQSITYITDPESENLGKVHTVTDETGLASTYEYHPELGEVVVTDSGGRQTVQRYDNAGNVTEVENAEGMKTTTEYLLTNGQNRFGEVRAKSDMYGNITTYERDSRGNVIKTTYPDGSTEQKTYDEYNNVIRSVDRVGAVTYYVYDAEGKHLLKAAKPLDGRSVYREEADESKFAVTAYTYYPDETNGRKGLVHTETGPLGDSENYTKYEYNTRGNLSRKTVYTDGKASLWQYTYNSRDKVNREINPDGVNTVYTYNLSDQLTKTTVTSADGTETSVQQTVYDGIGRAVKEISPVQTSSACTVNTYNTKGFLTKTANALGNEHNYVYDTWGNVYYETLANGFRYVYSYDKMNRKQTVRTREQTGELIRPLQVFAYGQSGCDAKVTTTTYLDASTTVVTAEVTDFEGKVQEQTNGEGHKAYKTYGKGGLLLSETDVLGNTVTYTYDAWGRVLTKTAPFENSSKSRVYYTYDKAGNVLTQSVRSNAVGRAETLRKTENTYDAWGRCVKTASYEGSEPVQYTQAYYDWAGRVLRQYKGLHSPLTITGLDAVAGNNDGDYSVLKYEYNYMGKVTKTTDALGQEESMAYDAAGNVTSLTDKEGGVHTVTYDLLGQPQAKTNSRNGKATITKAYTYDGMGNLTSASENGETETYTYDGRGRKLTETQGDIRKSFTYNNLGSMLGYTITENGETQQSVTNGYDALGRLASVTEDNTQKVVYTYDRGSRLVKTAYANGVTEERTYNEAGAVKTIETKNASGETLSGYSYTYYVDGNEHTKTGLSGTTEYTYDGLNRLKIALLPDGTKQTYTFDDNSNRTGLTVEKNGAVLEETTYTYNKNDQLLSENKQRGVEAPLITTYTYDAVGNMVEKSGAANAEQTFDVLNRMTGYTEGTTEASYEYQSDNMRSSKTVDGVTTEQVWVNGQIVMDKCGDTVVKYTYGSKLVESDYGWYSYDAHGNVTMLTDDTGAVIKRYDYDPYGVELGAEDSTDENPFRYSGQYTDRETGYVYLRARYYAPSLGRFLSMDLMMDGANWYIYCAGNPVMFIDPSGFEIIVYPNGKMVDRASGSELWNSHINGQTPREDIVIREATPVKREPSLLESIAVNSSAASSTNGGPQITAARHTWNFEEFVGGASLQTYNKDLVDRIANSYLNEVREDSRGYTVYELQSEVYFKGTTTFQTYSLYTQTMSMEEWKNTSSYKSAETVHSIAQGAKSALDYADFYYGTFGTNPYLQLGLSAASFFYNPSAPDGMRFVDENMKDAGDTTLVMYIVEKGMIYNSNTKSDLLVSGVGGRYEPYRG